MPDEAQRQPSATDRDSPKLLAQIRGALPGGRANARTVAALTDNPGCVRRRVIDSAGIRSRELAQRAGRPSQSEQSPFAIASGTMFEWRLKKGNGYQFLLDVLRETFGFEVENPRILDINRAPGRIGSDDWLIDRARQTDEALAAMARGDAGAPNLVDHPVLTFELAGVRMLLEPDALAFCIQDKLEIVEVKSYAVIDDQADPSKVASTAGQAAVYVLALRSALQRLGLNPDLVAWSAILVAPRNFSRQPTAHRIPLRKKAGAIARVLGSVPNTMDLLTDLPAGFTLGPDPKQPSCTRQTDEALRQLPLIYVPECLSSCDMAEFCRAEAVEKDDLGRIGRPARDAMAGVDSLSDVLRLARGRPRKGDEHVADVAEALRAAASALDRARQAAPTSCGLGPRSGGKGTAVAKTRSKRTRSASRGRRSRRRNES